MHSETATTLPLSDPSPAYPRRNAIVFPARRAPRAAGAFTCSVTRRASVLTRKRPRAPGWRISRAPGAARHVRGWVAAIQAQGADSPGATGLRNAALRDLLNEESRAQTAEELEGPDYARVDRARADIANVAVGLLLKIISQPSPRLARVRRCQYPPCGTPYFLDRASNGSAKFCSDNHRIAAHRQRSR